jgi:DNA-binding CsgD family transcriptional regulator
MPRPLRIASAPLAVRAGGRAVALGSLARLIDAIGRAGFEAAFLRFVHELMPSDHFVAQVYDAGNVMRGMLAASRGESEAARRNCLALRERYRRGELRPIKPVKGVGRQTWEEVADPRIRRDAYERFGILDRLTASCSFGGGFIVWSLYRDRRSGYYADEDRERLAAMADVLSAALARHAATGPLSINCNDEVSHSLAATSGARLSRREQQVYRGLTAGKTSEAMARDFGIGLATVLTYRRRLYRKFGVTTQRDLIARVLKDASATAH